MNYKTIVYMYIMASNKNANNIDCAVPDIRDDEEEIFFGPCKKRLRQKFTKEFLKDGKSPHENPTYIIGVNGSNKNKQRSILWFGRVSKVMSFAGAHTYIMDEKNKYHNMLKREDRLCSLHVEPITDNGQLVGYKYRKGETKEHWTDGEWVSDLASSSKKSFLSLTPNKSKEVEMIGKKRIADNISDILDRDCSFFCEPLFWANRVGTGIAIDDYLVDILKEAQPTKAVSIDNYAIFGKKNDNKSANGLTGWYLPITDENAERLVSHLKKRIAQIYNNTKSHTGHIEKHATRC